MQDQREENSIPKCRKGHKHHGQFKFHHKKQGPLNAEQKIKRREERIKRREQKREKRLEQRKRFGFGLLEQGPMAEERMKRKERREERRRQRMNKVQGQFQFEDPLTPEERMKRREERRERRGKGGHGHHHREFKFQQREEGPMTEQRMKRKERRELRKEERQLAHKEILQNYKKDFKYYDNQSDQWNKQKYYANLSNPTNYEELHKLVSSTFRHARRRENIFPIVDRQPDYTLRCVYSGKILSDAEGNNLEKCDEEHSFPQSYQRGMRAGTGRDMHAIFAAFKSANGSRGNTPFGLYSQDQKVIEEDEYGTIFSGKPKTYIPKMNQGAVARSTLYILLCYKGCANSSYLPKETLPWLAQIASSSQVSLWQKHRNQQLYRLQGNRNPFIDYPELAKMIDFSEGWQKQ